MTRRLLVAASAASAALVAAGSGGGDPIPPAADLPVPAPSPVTIVPAAPVAELKVAALERQVRVERRRRVRLERRVHTLTRTLAHRSSTREAIQLACTTYGRCGTLWRRAACETGGTYSPDARNPSGASGLFQFLPSTWATTPYAGLSIWSPYANALAAGWMEAHGRGREWVCR